MNKCSLLFSETAMDSVPNVVIDEGTFKYVIVEITDGKSKKSIVRGFRACEYHDDILEEIKPDLLEKKLSFKCTGGGRIYHDSLQKKIEVYGYSQAYGKADHELAVKKLSECFPGYSVSVRQGDHY
ncbi:14 kDa phosphohistidine phosphatase [Trichuris trichiura]|uniref:14 kDa phosphohistidine phosphatase n=1 Tax=Trichuris trichiura TaxID=36087 RepID=A0A077Z1B0_TRITR|nr:14 kDa phosphohistidine phosphatase [Trichuris trichiura]